MDSVQFGFVIILVEDDKDVRFVGPRIIMSGWFLRDLAAVTRSWESSRLFEKSRGLVASTLR